MIDGWCISGEMPLDECHSTILMISQYWFRLWLGAVRQQAITWTNVDPDLCHHIASWGHNEEREFCLDVHHNLNRDMNPLLYSMKSHSYGSLSHKISTKWIHIWYIFIILLLNIFPESSQRWYNWTQGPFCQGTRASRCFGWCSKGHQTNSNHRWVKYALGKQLLKW